MACSLRFPLALAALVLALAAAPVSAQQQLQQQHPQGQRTPVGLPLYTSDGKAIGKVIATGVDEDDEPVLVAEIGRTLGLGSTAIAVPADLFVRKPGRIELTLTEAEVKARLGR
jgi:PRC-barrel domain protein